MIRPTKHEVFMRVAEAVATRGTCPRLQVGAVVVDENEQIVSTGYNGAPAGEAHCLDAGCATETLEGGKAHCVRAVHAEINALIQAGKKARGGWMYVTHSPCRRCLNVIANAGVRTVYYREAYGSVPESNRVRVEQLNDDAATELCRKQAEAMLNTLAGRLFPEAAPTYVPLLTAYDRVRVCYVAGPYTGPSDTEVRMNIANAKHWGERVAVEGIMPLIPHCNTDQSFVKIQNADFWYRGTMRLLETSDAVLLIPRWENSKGSKAEKARAEALHIPVFFHDQWDDFSAWARGTG